MANTNAKMLHFCHNVNKMVTIPIPKLFVFLQSWVGVTNN